MFFQLLCNGLLFGLRCALLGIGFCLLYRTHRFLDFGYGISAVLGAYLTLLLTTSISAGIVCATILGAALAGSMGVVLYSTIYRLLHRRGGGALIGLLCSLGIYTAAQNLIQLFFGTKNQPLQNWPVREGVAIGGARITSLQLYDAVATMAVLLCIAFLLARTRVGRNLRAIGNDIELAVCVGIPVERDKLISAFLAYSIGGVAGTLTALESNLRPTMGFDALLAGVVAAIVGGTGSLLGAFWGGLFVGVITHLGIWKLDSEWQAAMMFAILLLFLLVRPAGFLGIPRSG